MIEDVLGEQDFIKSSEVNLKRETVTILTESEHSPEEIAQQLTEKVKANGYSISVEKEVRLKKSNDVIWKALPIGLAFLVLFFILH
jgi:5S rRNA maturation endonuclease (ribonuclease M5)